MDKEYLAKLESMKTIKLLFIGKDPYPTNPNGIPFCKPIAELKKNSCSGRHLLNGFGVNIDNYLNSADSSKIFFDLLSNLQIGFLNASYDKPQKMVLTNEQRMRFKSINTPLINKSNFIVSSYGAFKLLKQYIDKEALNKITPICHPDIRNRNSKKYQKDYDEIWGKEKGIFLKFKILV